METLKVLIAFSILTSSLPSDVENKYSMQNVDNHEDHRQISPPKTYRLPNETRPNFYNLFMLATEVDQKNFKFWGNVKIDITVLKRAKTVTLHSRNLTIQRIQLQNKTYNLVASGLSFEHIEDYDFLVITLPRDYQIDEQFVLNIDYYGWLGEDESGFYRGFYYDGDEQVDKNKIYYAVTQFQPIYARKAFPCYDEIGIKTPFAFKIEHPKDYSAFFNTELVFTEYGDDFAVSRFFTTPPMQTYAVAFIVAPFDLISNRDKRVPQRIIARRDAIENGEANFSVKLVGPLLRIMEEQVGINFPLTKLDHAAVNPLKTKGMDNWGLSTYLEYSLLINPNLTLQEKIATQRHAIQLIAHEHAHQFFGNVITPHWWTDLWLNEGFATFYEYYVPQLWNSNYGFMDTFRKSELDLVLKHDLDYSLPLSFYVESPSGIESSFDTISYSKGSAFLRMFQVAYGPKTFTKGIKTYFQRKQNSIAEPKDLFSAFQKACDEDLPAQQHNVEMEMSRWVFQAGYPLVSVSIENNQFLVFEQHRYPKPKKDEIYSIPLSYATKKQPNFELNATIFWLHQKELRIPLGFLYIAHHDWIIFNVQQTGVYRVNYSPQMWSSIARGLRENINAIHPINREVLMAELKLAFFKLDEILISGVFEVMMFLHNEEQFSVWEEVEKIITQIQFNFVGTESYDDFLKFMQYISRKQMKRLGFHEIPGEPEDDAHLRGAMIDYNCFSADILCHDYQLDQLELLLNGNTKVDVNFCAAFSRAKQSVFEFLLNHVIHEKDPDTRIFYLLGLTCSRERTQLQQLIIAFEHVLINELSDQDVIIGISKMFLTSPEAQTEAMEYLEKFPQILEHEQIRDVLKQSINTIDFEERVKKIVKSAHESNFITSPQAAEVLAGMGERNYWHARNFKHAQEWFKKEISILESGSD